MNKSYFYTETAFHHEGDLSYLKGLIDATKETGAAGIKFQVMTKTADFISTKHSAFTTLDSYHFSLEEWAEVFKYTQDIGLDIIMMPLNSEALQLLDQFDVKYLDIHSVCFYDTDLLEKIKETNREIILGVGGRTMEEIIEKIKYFDSRLKVLMVGFQSFPSQLEDVNIGKITYLKNLFPDCQIGYADHSAFDSEHAISSNEYARLLGATFFEKHITLEEGIERVDFSAAVGFEKIKTIIDKVSFLEQNVLTDFVQSFNQNEKEIAYRNRQLVCVCAEDFKQGYCLKREDVLLKLKDNTELHYSRIDDLIGKRLITDLEKDNVIRQKDIANSTVPNKI